MTMDFDNSFELLKEDISQYSLKDLLDIATGKGEFINFLQSLTSPSTLITAVDSNSRIIEYAKNQHPQVKFKIANAYSLPFNDNSFDLISLSNSLHHFAHPEKVITEMKRVSKDSGKFLIQEMVSDDDQSPAQKSHILIHHFCAQIDMICESFHDQTWKSTTLMKFIQSQFTKILFQAQYSYPVKDVHDSKQIDRLSKAMEIYIGKLSKESDIIEMQNQRDEILSKLHKNGFSPARQYLFLLK